MASSSFSFPPSTASADLSSIRQLSSEEDPLVSMKAEINMWIETLSRGQQFDDPVFEGMVRDFIHMDHSLNTIFKGVENFLGGVDKMCEGLMGLSESLVEGFTKHSDHLIASDCCKFREAMTGITRSDAPHSIIAKLKRDLDFNVATPLKAHLIHNKKLKSQLENRRRRLQELNKSKKSLEALKATPAVVPTDHIYVKALEYISSCQEAFDEVDRPVFEWLMMLEEYKGDIYDSLIQTLKYLQYEFFAGSAHCVSYVLPTRMEFRPLIEMTPEQLEPQVEMELNESQYNKVNGGKSSVSGATNDKANASPDKNPGHDATLKILQKWERDGGFPEVTTEAHLPVDQLSLSLLVSQGFDEGPSRRALRLHQNDSQAALECLLGGCSDTHTSDRPDEAKAVVVESVRVPTSLKWVQKLKDRRALERKSREERSQSIALRKDTTVEGIVEESKRKDRRGYKNYIDREESSRKSKSKRSHQQKHSSDSERNEFSSDDDQRYERRQQGHRRRRKEKREKSQDLLQSMQLSPGEQSAILLPIAKEISNARKETDRKIPNKRHHYDDRHHGRLNSPAGSSRRFHISASSTSYSSESSSSSRTSSSASNSSESDRGKDWEKRSSSSKSRKGRNTNRCHRKQRNGNDTPAGEGEKRRVAHNNRKQNPNRIHVKSSPKPNTKQCPLPDRLLSFEATVSDKTPTDLSSVNDPLSYLSLIDLSPSAKQDLSLHSTSPRPNPLLSSNSSQKATSLFPSLEEVDLYKNVQRDVVINMEPTLQTSPLDSSPLNILMERNRRNDRSSSSSSSPSSDSSLGRMFHSRRALPKRRGELLATVGVGGEKEETVKERNRKGRVTKIDGKP